MVMSQPILLLRARSPSVVLQQQGSVSISMAHITTREDGMILFSAASRDHVDVQGLCIIGPTVTG